MQSRSSWNVGVNSSLQQRTHLDILRGLLRQLLLWLLLLLQLLRLVCLAQGLLLRRLARGPEGR